MILQSKVLIMGGGNSYLTKRKGRKRNCVLNGEEVLGRWL